MSVAKCFLSFLNKIIHKKDIILFNSYPAYSDNSLALYKYIFDCRKDLTQKYKLLWGQESEDEIPSYLDKYKIKAVDKKSVKGIITFLSAKYVFSTHGYFPDLKSGNGQIQVNLWHGCGYKRMPEKDLHYLGDKLIVTSDLYVKLSAKDFNMNKKDILPLGYPRNDNLNQKGKLQCLVNDYHDFSKIIIWLPTYRKSETGHIGIDGSEKSFCIGNISEDDFSALNDVLVERNYLLVIKPHPMDAQQMANMRSLSNINVFTNNDLKSKGVDLYDILPDTDALISDYSSVVIDYVLTRKPIIMALSDMKEYSDNRGFVFDNLQDYFPGPIVSNIDELKESIAKLDSIQFNWKDKRLDLLYKFQNFHDALSSKRICDYFFGEIKQGE